MDEDTLRRIVREEVKRALMDHEHVQRDYYGRPVVPMPAPLPVGRDSPTWGMACACGPGQCARLQSSGIPCAHFRQFP